MKIPRKTKELVWSKAGENYVLLDPQTQKTFTIDSIGFLVWVQCDGKTSLEEITDIFSVSKNRDIVRAAVKGIVDKLVESGLVVWE